MGGSLKKLLYRFAPREKDIYGNETELDEKYLFEESEKYITPYHVSYDYEIICGLIIVTLMTKRKRLCGGGYFALAVPINFLECRQRRTAFIAAFALTTVTLIDFVNYQEEMTKNMNRFMKVAFKLTVAAFCSCRYFPLFASIYKGTIAGSIVGLLYLLSDSILSILDEIPAANVSIKAVFKVCFLRGIVFSVTCSYLFYWFSKQIYQQCRKKNDKNVPQNQIKYVKRLLLPKERYLMSQMALKLHEHKGNFIVRWFRKNIYHNVPGFRYSLSILVSCTVGYLIITHMSIMVFYNFIENFISVINLLEMYEPLQNATIKNYIEMSLTYLTQSNKYENLTQQIGNITFYDFLCTQSMIIVGGSLLAAIVAYILSLLTICHVLTLYRENVLNLSMRKERQAILYITKEFSNIALVVSAIQFAGFQVAYFMAGFSIHLFLLTVVFILLGEVVILPIQFALETYVVTVAEIVVPIAIALILIPLIQKLFVKYLFLEDRGRTMTLTNRRGFFIMTYSVFFYNIFAGAFSCARRIAKGTLVGLLLIPRLDKSTFPRSFEHADPAFRAYSCLLHLEALQSNSIVRIFISLISKRNSFRSIKEYKVHVEGNSILRIGPDSHKSKQMRVAVNRWFVAYTMIRNPCIIPQRGLFNMLSNYKENSVDPTSVQTESKK